MDDVLKSTIKEKELCANTKNVLLDSKICQVFFFQKKKKHRTEKLKIEDLKYYTEDINKSEMVVFCVEKYDKKLLLEELKKYCRLSETYRPIIETGKDNIYFFPKLNYGDVFFIRDILLSKLEKINIKVILNEDI